MSEEKECIKCGDYFKSWEGEDMCDDCREGEEKVEDDAEVEKIEEVEDEQE